MQLIYKEEKTVTRIIQEDIKKVKRMSKRAWHDADWWAYMSTDKTRAIWLAIDEARYGDHIRDITENANKYYKAMED